jgi:hypothetical protein
MTEVLSSKTSEGGKMKLSVCVFLVLVVNVFLANICIAGGDRDIKSEFDAFRSEMLRPVEDGDIAVMAACDLDAGVINGPKETICQVSETLNRWKQGVKEAILGKMKARVVLRFNRRTDDEHTAPETELFDATAIPEEGQGTGVYFRFEAFRVKEEGWKLKMGYQKGPATEAG